MKTVKRSGAAAMLAVALSLSGLLAAPAHADELLQMIQQDLALLGYEVGAADGKLGLKTQLAIGKFEEANEMPVTGKPSLAVAAAISNQADAVRKGGAQAAGAQSAAAAAQAQAECLQRLAAAKQAQAQKGKGMRALANTGATIAGRFGGPQLARDLQQVTRTADDLARLSSDLGLTAEESAECGGLPSAPPAGAAGLAQAPGAVAVAADPAMQAKLECLQRVAAEKEAKAQKGKGLAALAKTGATVAGRFGGAQLARDIQNVTQSAQDVAALAGDFGLTADEAAQCGG